MLTIRRWRPIVAALAALLLTAGAQAASLPQFTGPAGTNPAMNPTILGDLNATINAINSGVTPGSMATFSANRNFLDNGGMSVAQRGTAAATGGTTSGCPLTTYVADRWCVDTNVTSGAGKGQVVTSTPTPPAGFTNSMTVFRNSGALLQPVCAIQEIKTSNATQLAGQPVVLSFYAQALAGLAADNGNVINATIITGTGTDQGLGTLTASPAITPAWTGLATPLNAQAQTITTSWVRYTMPAVVIGSTATEVGVELCFTPTATGAGTTDGFAVTGVQLEQGNVASPFEFRPLEVELARAQNYYYRYAELAAAYQLNGVCEATGAATNSCTLNLPQQMFKIPTIAITTAGTFKVNIAGTLTTIATPTAGACGLNTCLVTAANTNTAGQVELLSGAAGGSGVWEVSADF
jgi:hypothetical protein